MKFEFSTNTLESISADAAIVFAFNEKNEKKESYLPLSAFKLMDEVLNSQLTKIAQIENFKGKKGEIINIVPQKKVAPSKIIIIGLGSKKDFTADTLRKVLGDFSKKMRNSIDSASIVLPSKKEINYEYSEILFTAVEGLLLGSYTFLKYKKKEKNEREFATVIIAQQEEKQELIKVVNKAQLFYEATRLARDLVNEQSAIVTPAYLANLALDIAKGKSDISCKVYDRDEIEKMGMGAFLGVARASETQPKFIHLEYAPKKAATKEKWALVGKGVTFDSGGINVKTGDGMVDMKMDMAGAAVVLGIFSVISKIQPPFPVMGIIAATPNLISSNSLLPGDVVKAYNGKTIEILNTDAEGRVTLADSLAYASKQGATKIIDFATLTGACVVALGNEIAGLFSNNRELVKQIEAAAIVEGEKMWELPLEKDYKEMNKSDVADISNIPSNRYGGALTAALFLEEFVDDKVWAHLDIAGPAFLAKPTDISLKGGTGFGVRTMLQLFDTAK